MAERMRDGGGTRVDQAERNEQADPAEQERSKPVEAERRPTYKTLDEQQGRLTEAEERFERGRRTIGLFLGPLVFLLLLVLPLGLEAKQQALAAVLGLVVVWWITEALPIDWAKRRFTLNWNQASRIDWGTILLFGAGIALGGLMRETGLAKTIGEGLADALNVSNLVSITIVSVIIAVIISETTSNTASAAIVVPIAIAISAAVQVDPVIPALAAIFGANYGFMLPVSTPPNAIVYSSGMLPITRMVKTGAVFDVIGAILCVVGVAIMANVVGLV